MVGHGGVWSKMGKGEVAGTVGPASCGALTPAHLSTQGSKEGALLVFSVAPTVYHKAPGRDSDDTGASLCWLEPLTSWVVTLPCGGQGGGLMFPPAS